MSSGTNDLFMNVETLRNLLVSRATTQGPWNGRQYTAVRQELLAIPGLKEKLPTFIQTTFTLDDFWSLIKLKGFDTYQQRRDFLRTEFTPVLQYLESQQTAPADQPITSLLKTWGTAEVHAAWEKALDRRHSDPEGAITAARTLLETICKSILHKQGVAYDEEADLPNLYRSAAMTLSLAPEQHHEEVFKRILGGCQTVVTGLGTLRNKMSDAHGRAPGRGSPAARHAALAVNLAGSMAMFLVETFQAKNTAAPQ